MRGSFNSKALRTDGTDTRPPIDIPSSSSRLDFRELISKPSNTRCTIELSETKALKQISLALSKEPSTDN